jgi:pre-rRNA-processing protein TSR3
MFMMICFGEVNEVEKIPLHVIHLNQDDPKKCTSRKMHRYGLIKLHTDIRKSPRTGFLLDPLAGVLLGPDDKSRIAKGTSIVGLDCSWKQIDDSISYLSRKTRLEGRTLPVVLAANPVSWGKPGRLSNVEAFAVSLIVLGEWEQARQILGPFKFSDEFFRLNHEPLEAYSQAKDNLELAELQWEFFDKPD